MIQWITPELPRGVAHPSARTASVLLVKKPPLRELESLLSACRVRREENIGVYAHDFSALTRIGTLGLSMPHINV